MKHLIIVVILLLLLKSCNVYERVDIEEIHPPQIEQDSITIPDWEQIRE